MALVSWLVLSCIRVQLMSYHTNMSALLYHVVGQNWAVRQ
jgi:hypothetical protein